MLKRVLALCLAVLLAMVPFTGVSLAAEVDYTHHVVWMQQEGILAGTTQGLEVDRAITRAEMATLLGRVLGWTIPNQTVAIKDVPKNHWAYGPIQAAVANGAISLQNGMAHPSATLSALDAFTMAKRVDITLDLKPSVAISRGQLLHALGEAITKTITIVHTNDTHGRILSDNGNGILGWEKIATIIEETRCSNPNTLVLDGGDALHGVNESQLFQGASMVAAMNSAGVDVMVPGNHDFNYGYSQLLRLEKDAAFSIVAANVKDSEGAILDPYVIREVGGIKIGIFGLSSVDTPVLTHPKNVEGLTFDAPEVSAQTMVAELQDKADFIIALTHIGYTEDKTLALAVTGIDMIVGGHSHTEALTAEKVGDTYIVQAGEHSKNVGRQNLVFYKGELVQVVSTPVAYSEYVMSSPRTSKLAAEIKAKMDAEMNTVIGTAAGVLDGERANVRTKETNLGNLIADVLRLSTDADVAITNGGGIRASINEGDITKGEVFTVLPFGNRVFTVNVTGAQLKAALEHAVSGYPAQKGNFAQVSGLTFTFDASKPAYERVVEVKVAGEALDLDRMYKLATNDFMAAGGDGYTMLAEGVDPVDTGISMFEYVMEYMQNNSPVRATVEDRIKVIGG